MYKVQCGPTVFFDCDDTILMWSKPEDFNGELVTVRCRGFVEQMTPNKHNITLLKKLAARGHAIVCWSGGGADWAEAVVKALHLEEYVSVVTGKPQYYIDDVANPKEWIGKHGYFDMDGNRIHGDNFSKITDKEN